MRLKITQGDANKHTKMVSAVGWSAGNELHSVGDDKLILKWSLDGEPGAQVSEVDTFPTDMQWQPSMTATSSELFAVGCSDGTLRFYRKTGMPTGVKVEAHVGAITCIRWNSEGTALATAGEDGLVKQYSQAGNLQSKLAQSDHAIYSICWAPDNQAVLYSSGSFITIKPLRVTTKVSKWKAHNGTVLKVDWNPINNLIVSGGEDCKYKVWDSYGRCLFTSKAFDHPITSVRWCPNGDYFAVGSFNMLSLCDKTGWTHSRTRTADSGSLLALDWTVDGTHLAAAGASGAVCFGHLVDRSVEWKQFEATLNEANQIIVQDVTNDNHVMDELEFGQRVIDLSMNYGHLVVVTVSSCYVYQLNNLSTPHVFDMKGTVSLILQCEKYFLLVDNVRGMQVFTYEGRLVCNPKIPNLHPQYLKSGNVSLSADCLAVIDKANPNLTHILDIQTGKPLSDPVKHEVEIVEVALSQTGLVSDRKLLFIDRNRDLFLATVHRPSNVKLGPMVDTAMWSDTTDVLAAVSDSKLIVWFYPNVVYVDKDLVHATRSVVDASAFGKLCQFVSFSESRVTIRRADGALQTASILPFPAMLYKFVALNQWDRCVRLCRLVKEDVLWACLAVMAINGNQLDTAEIALSAIEEVDKLQFIQSIKAIPSLEGRNAALLLYRRRPAEAEALLLQSGLIYRAISQNIQIFRWERALELAVQHKTHVDTVLAYRQRYLSELGLKETDSKFAQLADKVKVDWDTIRKKQEQEAQGEQARGTVYESKMLSVPVMTFAPLQPSVTPTAAATAPPPVGSSTFSFGAASAPAPVAVGDDDLDPL